MIFIIFFPAFSFAYDLIDCHFAQSYSTDDLTRSPDLQDEFLMRASWWEGKFASAPFGTLFNGMTSGVLMDPDTGRMIGNLQTLPSRNVYSSPEQEAIQLALFASALNGGKHARNFFSSSFQNSADSTFPHDLQLDKILIDLLAQKILAYDIISKGYLPNRSEFSICSGMASNSGGSSSSSGSGGWASSSGFGGSSSSSSFGGSSSASSSGGSSSWSSSTGASSSSSSSSSGSSHGSSSSSGDTSSYANTGGSSSSASSSGQSSSTNSGGSSCSFSGSMMAVSLFGSSNRIDGAANGALSWAIVSVVQVTHYLDHCCIGGAR